ncbi:MAG: CapA family protein [Lachnospiraceae bacterium]|nr:CapA family protein [Lachnospiraceae bacterium]
MKKWKILGIVIGIELVALVSCLLLLHFGSARNGAGTGTKRDDAVAAKEAGEEPQTAGAYRLTYENLDGTPIAESTEEDNDYDLSWEKVDPSEKVLLETAAETEETEEEPRPITLLFAGDILFDDNYSIMAKTKARGGDIRADFDDASWQVMQDADFFMLNNEFPYSDRGTPTEGKTFTFRARPEYANYVKEMGVDLVSLANNHAYDHGEIALLDTLDTLTEAELPYIGAGRNLEEASTPYILEMGGSKVAILAATEIERIESPDTKGATAKSPGVFRCLDDTLLLQKIKECKEAGYYTIVFVHWGTENVTEIDYWQNRQSKEFAQAGADLIIGAHPHILQGMANVEGVPVVFSLGNYLFNSSGRNTGLFEVTLEENTATSYRFYPGRQENCAVRLSTGAEMQQILEEMRQMSPGVTIDENGYVFFQ